MDEFATVQEVSERLKVNPQTARNWIDRGELPAVRVGSRRVRVRNADRTSSLGLAASRCPREPPVPEHSGLLADPEVVEALRAFGESALALAQALERSRE